MWLVFSRWEALNNIFERAENTGKQWCNQWTITDKKGWRLQKSFLLCWSLESRQKKTKTKNALKWKLYIPISKCFTLLLTLITVSHDTGWWAAAVMKSGIITPMLKKTTKKTKHTQWLDTDILCKTPSLFHLHHCGEETNYCNGVWKRNWYKMWCHKYKKIGFDRWAIKNTVQKFVFVHYTRLDFFYIKPSLEDVLQVENEDVPPEEVGLLYEAGLAVISTCAKKTIRNKNSF